VVALHVLLCCSSHPALAKVAFTGSTATGQRVAQVSHMRRCMDTIAQPCCLSVWDACWCGFAVVPVACLVRNLGNV
jgi:hypothetical protein